MINVPRGTDLNAAKAIAKAELPDGVRLGQGFRQGERAERCTFFVVDDRELQKALKALPVVIVYNFEDGTPGVEYINFTVAYESRADLQGKTC